MATCTKRQRPPDGRVICDEPFMAHRGLPGAKRGRRQSQVTSHKVFVIVEV